MTKGKKTAILSIGILLVLGATVASMCILPTINISFVRAVGAACEEATRVEIVSDTGEVRATEDAAQIEAFLKEVSKQTFTKSFLPRPNASERPEEGQQPEQPEPEPELRYLVKVYVGPEYIQYDETKGFTKSEGYTGKMIRGGYVADDIESLNDILQRFYDSIA